MFEPCRMWGGAWGSLISGMESTEIVVEGGGRQRRHTRGRAGDSKREGARDEASGELDLEAVVAGGLRLRERRRGGASKDRSIGPLAGQDALGFSRSPWLHGDAPEGNARGCNRVAIKAQRGGSRHHRERI